MQVLDNARSQLANIANRGRRKAERIKRERQHRNLITKLGHAYVRGRESEEDTDEELHGLMDEIRELAHDLEQDDAATLDLTDQPDEKAVEEDPARSFETL